MLFFVKSQCEPGKVDELTRKVINGEITKVRGNIVFLSPDGTTMTSSRPIARRTFARSMLLTAIICVWSRLARSCPRTSTTRTSRSSICPRQQRNASD